MTRSPPSITGPSSLLRRSCGRRPCDAVLDHTAAVPSCPRLANPSSVAFRSRSGRRIQSRRPTATCCRSSTQPAAAVASNSKHFCRLSIVSLCMWISIRYKHACRVWSYRASGRGRLASLPPSLIVFDASTIPSCDQMQSPLPRLRDNSLVAGQKRRCPMSLGRGAPFVTPRTCMPLPLFAAPLHFIFRPASALAPSSNAQEN
jgi:hypothetical protein